MTPCKSDILCAVEAVLAEAEPEQLERLLRDIANGEFSETAQTRAGKNDNPTNVTNITANADQHGKKTISRSVKKDGVTRSGAPRQRYSS